MPPEGWCTLITGLHLLQAIIALLHLKVWHQHGLQDGMGVGGEGHGAVLRWFQSRALLGWTVVVHSLSPLVSTKEMLPPKALLPVPRLTTVAEKVRGVP